MVKIVVDSSVLIQNLRLGKDLFFSLIEKADEGRVELLIPALVVMEIWSGKSMASLEMQTMIEKRLKIFRVVDFDEVQAKKAGQIRRECQIGAMDAAIAACAIIEEARVATLNVKDFKKVQAVKLFK